MFGSVLVYTALAGVLLVSVAVLAMARAERHLRPRKRSRTPGRHQGSSGPKGDEHSLER